MLPGGATGPTSYKKSNVCFANKLSLQNPSLQWRLPTWQTENFCFCPRFEFLGHTFQWFLSGSGNYMRGNHLKHPWGSEIWLESSSIARIQAFSCIVGLRISIKRSVGQTSVFNTSKNPEEFYKCKFKVLKKNGFWQNIWLKWICIKGQIIHSLNKLYQIVTDHLEMNLSHGTFFGKNYSPLYILAKECVFHLKCWQMSNPTTELNLHTTV